MTKSELQSFMTACENANVKKIAIRYEDGSRSIITNADQCKVELLDDYAIFIEPTHNYATSDGQYNVTCCPYDYIDNARALDLTIQQTIDLLTELNLYDPNDDEMKEFIGNTTKRATVIPGTAGMDTIKDSDGNDVIPPGSVGYVTYK